MWFSPSLEQRHAKAKIEMQAASQCATPSKLAGDMVSDDRGAEKERRKHCRVAVGGHEDDKATKDEKSMMYALQTMHFSWILRGLT